MGVDGICLTQNTLLLSLKGLDDPVALAKMSYKTCQIVRGVRVECVITALLTKKLESANTDENF